MQLRPGANGWTSRAAFDASSLLSTVHSTRPVRAGALFVGCQRVTGDEEEDGVDDLDNEFNWNGHDSRSVADSMLYGHMSYGRGGDPNGVPQPFQLNPNVPLLTNGQMVLLLPNPSITAVPLPPPLVIDVSMAQLLVSGVIAGR
jgi:hypothetical protein